MSKPNGKTRAEERIDEIDVSPTALIGQIEELRTELETARKERDEYVGALQRERADFQNFKRRQEELRAAESGLAAQGLILKVLALADDFDRAIAGRPETLAADPWAEGIAVIDRKLRSVLESEDVKSIEGAPGTAFDPALHEAIATVPTDAHPEGSIVEEVRRGYLLRDRVIRPALVAVATGAGNGDTTTTDTTTTTDDRS